MIRVGVVAPSPVARAGLTALLSPAGSALERDHAGSIVVTGQGRDLDDLLAAANEPTADGFDVVVVAGAIDHFDDAARALTAPNAPRLVLLGSIGDPTDFVIGLRGRAWGWLPTDADGEALRAAVWAVASGLIALDPATSRTWLESPGADIDEAPDADFVGEALTTREREVLNLIAQGLPNKSIGRQLGISEHTVKFHVAAILAKLNASSRAEAVRLGARHGWLTL